MSRLPPYPVIEWRFNPWAKALVGELKSPWSSPFRRRPTSPRPTGVRIYPAFLSPQINPVGGLLRRLWLSNTTICAVVKRLLECEKKNLRTRPTAVGTSTHRLKPNLNASPSGYTTSSSAQPETPNIHLPCHFQHLLQTLPQLFIQHPFLSLPSQTTRPHRPFSILRLVALTGQPMREFPHLQTLPKDPDLRLRMRGLLLAALFTHLEHG